MSNSGFHVKSFNDKVRAMTQSNSRVLTLSADEARSLQSEIFVLLAQIAELSRPNTQNVTVAMDGGGFK